MLFYALLAFAAFYGIKALTSKGEAKEKAAASAKNNLVGAGIVLVVATVLIAILSA